MSFTIVNNKHLSIQENGLEYGSIYLWNQTDRKVITDNIVKAKNGFQIFYEGLKGFKEINGMSYPNYDIDLVDNKGNIIMSRKGIFETVSKEGLETEKVQDQLPVTVTFFEGNISNPVKLKTRLYDTKTNAEIRLTTELKVTQF